MTRSAPRRTAARTPQSPTAPSPTTATVDPGRTPADRAAWCPVGRTSVSGSTLRSRSSPASSAGSRTSVPSACGTRTASPCPPSAPSPPKNPPRTHDVGSPRVQWSQTPSDQVNGDRTRSPTRTLRTASPTSSTTPRNSWPIRVPAALGSPPVYGHRSEPQTQAWVTQTTASRGDCTEASGTCSMRTSPTPWNTVARIGAPARGARVCVPSLAHCPPARRCTPVGSWILLVAARGHECLIIGPAAGMCASCGGGTGQRPDTPPTARGIP